MFCYNRCHGNVVKGGLLCIHTYNIAFYIHVLKHSIVIIISM
jgi:hypothetical protein